MQREVVWSERAFKEFSDEIVFIRQNSDSYADALKSKVLRNIQRVAQGTVSHRIDPHKTNNNGTYHFFEILKYRISYLDEPDKITIIRVRHTSMEPRTY